MMTGGTSLFGAGRWIRDSVRLAHSNQFVHLLTAPHQALLTLDAIGRSLYRMAIGRTSARVASVIPANGPELRNEGVSTLSDGRPGAEHRACRALTSRFPGLTAAGSIVLALWACSPLAIRWLVMQDPETNAREFGLGTRQA